MGKSSSGLFFFSISSFYLFHVCAWAPPPSPPSLSSSQTSHLSCIFDVFLCHRCSSTDWHFQIVHLKPEGSDEDVVSHRNTGIWWVYPSIEAWLWEHQMFCTSSSLSWTHAFPLETHNFHFCFSSLSDLSSLGLASTAFVDLKPNST